MYHIMRRGSQWDDILPDDVDRQEIRKKLAASEPRSQWVRVDRLSCKYELRQYRAVTRQEFERRMEARRMDVRVEEGLKVLRRGGVGSEPFKSANARLHTAMKEETRIESAQDHRRRRTKTTHVMG
jgi:hypothetical protein